MSNFRLCVTGMKKLFVCFFNVLVDSKEDGTNHRKSNFYLLLIKVAYFNKIGVSLKKKKNQ